ncbi:isocitrate lyase/phosphoenolpyruvate mutase family protein [Bradyrhizobium sp. LHD-71]|uniref:isocitrate lyase/PEP mutase family protein n=1 Tax=Bradyrhizobium sp. LHD-71 TaxID=3072141 RepID=UPI00280C47C2|nr:isocitrate lyase/phosphoenolpyruvate mutase family protein [Bradyrhizobium sp. LHD-71]MDQ8729969.1 isocitrate lyase/phosphoenolpyruvate mutase family protein [Bradyrhizobium sp. LHD-71]
MTVSVAKKRKEFFDLHESGCFVLPNPWDVGSARVLQSLGYKALASTSAGFAWSTGRSDYGLKLNDLLEHLTALSAATDLPVNADFESGFADDPAGVAENVRKCAATGVSGLSIENRSSDPKQPLYEFSLSVERIRAARAALDDDESGVLLVARCEGFLTGEADLNMTIKRLVAFAEAGADCLYAPGIRTPEQISAVVKAVAPKPVNVLVMSPDFKVAELAELGVRRVSLGGQLAAAAWGGFMRAAQEIVEKGTFTELRNNYSGRDLHKVFAQYVAK